MNWIECSFWGIALIGFIFFVLLSIYMLANLLAQGTIIAAVALVASCCATYMMFLGLKASDCDAID